MKSNLSHQARKRAFLAAVVAACLTAAPTFAQSSTSGTGSSTTPPTETSRPGSTSTSTTSGTTGAGTRSTVSGGTMSQAAAAGQQLQQEDKGFIAKAAKGNLKEQTLAQLASERATDSEVREYAHKLTRDHQKMNEELLRLAQSKGVAMEGELAQLKQAAQGTMGSVTASTRSTTGTTAPGTGSTARSGSDTTGKGPAMTPPATSSTGATSTTGTQGMGAMAMVDDADVRQLRQASGSDFDQRFVKAIVEEHENAVELFEKAAKESKDSELRTFASQHVGSLREHLKQAQNLQRSVAE